tara:strand:- start:385 stop:615 length:231 start_codon:yes stop_codon:yes gene_type:complete
MKNLLTEKEMVIVSKLIDLNYEYFQAKKMDNPIVNQINDHSDSYSADETFEVNQRDLVELRYKVEDFFNWGNIVSK